MLCLIVIPVTFEAAIFLLFLTGGQVEEYRRHLATIAMMGANAPFFDLLPPAAQAHLQIASDWQWVRG